MAQMIRKIAGAGPALILMACLAAPARAEEEPQATPPPAAPAPPAPPRARRTGDVNVFVHSGDAKRSYLGVGLAEVDAERAQKLKLKEEYGVEITTVDPDSPAAQAGLKERDVVLEYNGQRVEGSEQFARMVRETPPGRKSRLLISREGVTQTLTATIGEKKRGERIVMGPLVHPEEFEKFKSEFEGLERWHPMPDIPSPQMSWRSSVLGIEAEALQSQFAEYFGVKEGVLVRHVKAGTPAEKAGLKAGDVIVKVGEQAVKTPSDVTRALRKEGPKKSVTLSIKRNQKDLSLTVNLEQERSGFPLIRPVAIAPGREMTL